MKISYGHTQRPRQASAQTTRDTAMECDLLLKTQSDRTSLSGFRMCQQLWSFILVGKDVGDGTLKL